MQHAKRLDFQILKETKLKDTWQKNIRTLYEIRWLSQHQRNC